jgi:cytochrome c553
LATKTDSRFIDLATVRALLPVLALALVTSAAWSAPGNPPGGDAARGQRLFYAHGCYGCHGYNGETGARDLVGTGSPLIQDEATFRLFLRLRADQAPDLPSARMPNFPATALPDADVHDLFAFIRTLRASTPKVEDVPTLRRILDIASRPANAVSLPASPAPGTQPAR